MAAKNQPAARHAPAVCRTLSIFKAYDKYAQNGGGRQHAPPPLSSVRVPVVPAAATNALQTRYSLSPAVILVALMASPASWASCHFQSVKAGWS